MGSYGINGAAEGGCRLQEGSSAGPGTAWKGLHLSGEQGKLQVSTEGQGQAGRLPWSGLV